MFEASNNDERQHIQMSGKKSYLVLLVKIFAWLAILDVAITIITATYAFLKDNPHSNTKLMLAVMIFNKTTPTVIISAILIGSSTHSDRIDGSAGWVIVMLLNFFWDVCFLFVGVQYLKYEGTIKTTESTKSILFLIFYKIFFVFFFLVSAIYSYLFINTHPKDLYKRRKSSYSAIPRNVNQRVKPPLM